MSSARRAIQPGKVLQETYEILRLIGAGGMGEVYEARHARLPGRFAVKVLADSLGDAGADEFLRFRREAEIASSLRHPNIVQVVDFNQMEDGSPYIVMEFLEGADLGSELKRAGRFSARRTGAIVGQIGDALAAAHARGIVHRDLKPQNVLLIPVRGNEGDFVKVVDFGISKVKTVATLTDNARLLGTPQYMSPEQARGRTDEIDGRTDQFALAAMAYEMLAGRVAFAGDSVPSILFKITNDEPPPLSELTGSSSAAIEAVLRRGLAKEKEERYGSIVELADALAAAIAGVPGAEVAPSERRGSAPHVDATATTVQSVPGAPAPSPRRSRRLWIAGALTGAAAIALVAVLRRGTPAPEAARTASTPGTVVSASPPVAVPATPADAAPPSVAPEAVDPARTAPAPRRAEATRTTRRDREPKRKADGERNGARKDVFIEEL